MTAAAADKPPPVCEHGNPRCGAVPTRLYICGPRCDQHQPAITRPFFQRQEQQP